MIQELGNLVQRIIGRPALGAAVALALCVPVLGAALALPMGPTKIVLAFVGAFAVGLSVITLGVLLVGKLLGRAQGAAKTGEAAASGDTTAEDEPLGLSIDLREDDPATNPPARSRTLPSVQAKALQAKVLQVKTLPGAVQSKARARAVGTARTIGRPKAAERPEPIVLPPPPSGRVHITD